VAMAKKGSGRFNIEYVSWSAAVGLCRRLASRIQASGFEPDVVVAIARGGFVPARVVCDYLGVKALESLRIVHYGPGAEKKERPRLASEIKFDLKGKKVLLVDDVIDSGGTLELARPLLLSLRPAAFLTAVLQVKPGGSVAADFVGRRIRTWRWVVYPWAAMEDLGAFASNFEPRPDSPGELADRFRHIHATRLPRWLAEDLWQRLVGG